ncbi:hypothetical protein B0I27_1144 [Arcticibacter pallidicorallinus]|uniref:RHS repeat-associated protein n=1 Tax=Arcticibacter pallidicorallinus TaxID=1259464 RepID=A0A2T0TS71_9SPHI|nr:hypothetical protein B0I27_1144 [Arcticibacter pallidicorallinus]
MVDPLAEQRVWVSPFNYGQNNPINRNDPTGTLDDWVIDENNKPHWDPNVTSANDKDLKPGNTYVGKEAEYLAKNGNTVQLNSDGTWNYKIIQPTNEIAAKGINPSASSNVDWNTVGNGAMTFTGGALATVGGVAASLTGVGSPLGVTISISTGISAIGFGTAMIIDGFQGGNRNLPGGLGEAIDRGIGGNGTIGQALDIGSGGIPNSIPDGIMTVHGLYNSNLGKQMMAPHYINGNYNIDRRDNTKVLKPKFR